MPSSPPCPSPSFVSAPLPVSDRLAGLRALFAELGVDGYLIPHEDAFFSELTRPCDERLAFLTGFTGSAGEALVLRDLAVVFSDGRYTLQMQDELDPDHFLCLDSQDPGIDGWLRKQNQNTPLAIGFDPDLLSRRTFHRLMAALEGTGITLIPAAFNPVDRLWDAHRPLAALSLVEPFPHAVAGFSSVEKRLKMAQGLAAHKADAFYFSDPQSVAWLLNIRARDIPGTPVALSRLMLYADGSADWLIDTARVPAALQAHIGDTVSIVGTDPAALTAVRGRTIAVDPAFLSVADDTRLMQSGNRLIELEDPCLHPRSQKTEPELTAIRQAHRKDALAMIRFLAGLPSLTGPTAQKPIHEDALADQLRELRGLDPAFAGESFKAIIGWQANGAIIHYRPRKGQSAAIEGAGLLLVDSGGQYKDLGTTDITRTIALGAPTDEQRQAYTAVLKGHLAVSMACFPSGTKGVQIDALARAPLWDAGLDYAHGTGHGVGCYLSVHESAASLSPRGDRPLALGMVLSNEPGYYKAGAFGIRIENLCAVVDCGIMADTGRPRFGFETLTLVPYDKALIDWTLLSAQERAWIADYYGRIRSEIRPHLADPALCAWLDEALALPD